ncbi:hypothetical protein D3C72_2224830 [compost metagenome]
MLSMSLGFILSKLPSYGKLSRTISGSALTLVSIVLVPLMEIPVLELEGKRPVELEALLKLKPLVIPSTRSKIFVLTRLFSNSLSI